jgi:hypothetical protein
MKPTEETALITSIAGLLLAVTLYLTHPQAVANDVGDRITVLGADAVITNTTTLEQDLKTVTTDVEPRFFLQYVEQALKRNLIPLPEAAHSIFVQTSDRIFLQYAEQSCETHLSYPSALINDSVPPQPSRIMARMITTDTAVISWSTDEFASSAVMYSRQSGVHEFSVSQPLYVKEHEVMLSDLLPETRYFYRVHNVDQSGNAHTSSEYSFVASIEVYLPLVLNVVGDGY